MDLDNNLNLILCIIGIIIFFIIKKNNDFLSVKLDLIDYPNKNKVHKKNTSLIAIFPFFFLFLLSHFFFILNGKSNIDTNLIFFLALGSFLIGLSDDKINLNYSIKSISKNFKHFFRIRYKSICSN